MALEIKLRVRKKVGNSTSREVAVFVSRDGAQPQSAGTIQLHEAEIHDLLAHDRLAMIEAKIPDSRYDIAGDIIFVSEDEEI